MAHEVETMAWRHQVPWHGLGVEIKGDEDMEGWIAKSGLDWSVERCKMKIVLPDGRMADAPGRFAMVRSTDHRPLTYTGEGWKPFQNRDMIKMMFDYVKAGGAEMETMGSLRNGQIIWALARLKHSFNVGKGDLVKGYLMLTSAHVVGKANTARTTAIRVVCANTMAAAEASGGLNYRQNHLTEFDVEAAKGRIELAHEELAEAEKRYKQILKLKLSMEDAVKKVLIPVYTPDVMNNADIMETIMEVDKMPAKISSIVQCIEKGPGALPGNGWGVLNGVTYWTDHVAGTGVQSRLFRSWIGDYSRHKVSVEKKLLEMAA